MQSIIEAFHKKRLVFLKDRNFLINSLIDQQPATSYDLMNETVRELIALANWEGVTKVFGEEDRGGFIAALVAYEKKLPLAMVKWNPSGLEGDISIPFRNAYSSGLMYANGLEKGDKVVLVEDMVDSGGTIISMIKLLKREGIELVDVVVVAEKAEYQGIKKIEKETGVKVKSILKFTSAGKFSEVIWTYRKPAI